MNIEYFSTIRVFFKFSLMLYSFQCIYLSPLCLNLNLRFFFFFRFDRNGVLCPPGSRKAHRNHHGYCHREWNSRGWSQGLWRPAKVTCAKQETATTQSPSRQREPALITGTPKPGGVSPAQQKPRLWGMGPAQDLGGAALASGTQISEEGIEGWQNSPSPKVPLCRKEYLELEALKKKKMIQQSILISPFPSEKRK